MNIWRPYTQMKAASLAETVTRAEGAYLHLRDGRKIFDGISSWWVLTHGHCHPKITEAIALQAGKVDQVVFANFSHRQGDELAERLGHLLPPELCHVFFSDNGSTAVEVAMKMAYEFSRRRHGRSKMKFLAFDNGYHGDTCGAMSVSGDGTFTKNYSGLKFEVIRCRQGTRFSDPSNSWTSDFMSKVELHQGDIAALIVEPLIQGAGGMIVWPTDSLKLICETARKNKIPVIFDEVMTGFGRCGKMFSFQKTDFIPDILCLSKGLTGGALPLALTVAAEEVFDVFLSNDPDAMFFHGHSFTGNALSCAAANANLEIFRSEPVLERIKLIEDTHKEALERFEKKIPILESRVLGVVGAIELDLSIRYGSAFSRDVHRLCLEQGLYLRPLGPVIYLLPPYCANREEILWAWNVVSEVLGKLLNSVDLPARNL